MDLKKFNFPEPNMCQPTNPALLKEAKARGFYGERTPYNELFSELFFNGGKLNFKKDIPEDFRVNATNYFRSLAGSFEPKHEEKEAVCALILSELVEPVQE